MDPVPPPACCHWKPGGVGPTTTGSSLTAPARMRASPHTQHRSIAAARSCALPSVYAGRILGLAVRACHASLQAQAQTSQPRRCNPREGFSAPRAAALGMRRSATIDRRAASPTPRLLRGCGFVPQGVGARFARLRFSKAGEQLVGKIAQHPSKFAWIFCGIGPAPGGKKSCGLQRGRARNGLLEAAGLDVVAQPTGELFVLRRVGVLHADDHAQTLRKSHVRVALAELLDRKSTRLNSSHLGISYAVF